MINELKTTNTQRKNLSARVGKSLGQNFELETRLSEILFFKLRAEKVSILPLHKNYK